MAKSQFRAFVDALTEARDAAERASQVRGSIPLATEDAFEARCSAVRTSLRTGTIPLRTASIDAALCLYALFTTQQGELFVEPPVAEQAPTEQTEAFDPPGFDPLTETQAEYDARWNRIATPEKPKKRKAPGKNSGRHTADSEIDRQLEESAETFAP